MGNCRQVRTIRFEWKSPKHLMKMPEDWAKERDEGIVHNRMVLERIKRMLGKA